MRCVVPCFESEMCIVFVVVVERGLLTECRTTAFVQKKKKKKDINSLKLLVSVH